MLQNKSALFILWKKVRVVNFPKNLKYDCIKKSNEMGFVFCEYTFLYYGRWQLLVFNVPNQLWQRDLVVQSHLKDRLDIVAF